MTTEAMSIALSVAGLVLGLVSAWQPIKAFVLKAARFGGNAARSWVLKERSLVELNLDYPATLVAFLGRSGASLFLFCIALLLLRPEPLQGMFGLSSGLARAVSLVPACLIGLLLGSISTRCSDVMRLATKRKASQAAG